MTASYKLALAAGGALLLIAVATLFVQNNEPTPIAGIANVPPSPPPTPVPDDDSAEPPSLLPPSEPQRPPAPPQITYADDPPVADPPPLVENDPARSITLGPLTGNPGGLFAGEPDPRGTDPLESPDDADAEDDEELSDAPALAESQTRSPRPTAPAAEPNAPRAIGPIDPVSPAPDQPAAAEPTPPAKTQQLRLYTVESGDSMSSIALTHYGSAAKWVDIAQANPLVDPNRLRVGQELKLPDLPATDPPSTTGDEATAPRRGTTYVVKTGDTLSGIAKNFYSSSAKWELIYQANRRTIGNSPANLKVGMELLIPPPDSGAN